MRTNTIHIGICTQWGENIGSGHIMRSANLALLLIDALQQHHTHKLFAKKTRTTTTYPISFFQESDTLDSAYKKITRKNIISKKASNNAHKNITITFYGLFATPSDSKPIAKISPVQNSAQTLRPISLPKEISASFSHLNNVRIMCFFVQNVKYDMQKIIARSTHIIFDSYLFSQVLIAKALCAYVKCLIFDDSTKLPAWFLRFSRMPYGRHLSLVNAALYAQNLLDSTTTLQEPSRRFRIGTSCAYLGASFSLAPFAFANTAKSTTKAPIRHILITLGASNTQNPLVFLQALESLRSDIARNTESSSDSVYIKESILARDFHIHIVGTMHNPKEFASAYHHFYGLLSQSAFAELMGQCDLALSAGGQTLYELALNTLPTIIFPIASNQLAQSKAFAKSGAMMLCETHQLELDSNTFAFNDPAVLYTTLKHTLLCLTPKQRAKMKRRALQLAIGKRKYEIAHFFL